MAEASEPIVLPYNKSGSDVRGSMHDLAGYEHIHTEDGLCRKDRSYTCTAPKWESQIVIADHRPTVDVYDNGHFVTQVMFKKKWQARLFHELLNRSVLHAGVRVY